MDFFTVDPSWYQNHWYAPAPEPRRAAVAWRGFANLVGALMDAAVAALEEPVDLDWLGSAKLGSGVPALRTARVAALRRYPMI
jgi:hypothetical protein